MDPYKRTKLLYILNADFEYLISILVTGAFLARVTDYLGFSDSLTGIISAIASLGGLFQLLSIFLKRNQVKSFVVRMNLINQLLFLLLYVIPLTPLPGGVRAGAFPIVMVCAYFCLNIASPQKVNWLMSMVGSGKRGKFTAVMEAVSLVSGVLFSYVMGGVSDHYKEIGQPRTAFFLCTCVILLLMVLNMLTLIFSVEKPPEGPVFVERNPWRKFKVLADKKVFWIIMISSLWNISVYVLTPYYGSYQIKELGLGLQFISVVHMISSLVRILCSFFLGDYADKHSFVTVWYICLCIAAGSYFINIFTVPANGALLFTLYSVGIGATQAGVSASRNLIFEYVEYFKRADALALMQTITGLCGFFTTLLVSPLVGRIQANGNRFLGQHFYAQQILSIIAFLFCILAVLLMMKTLCRWEKPEKME